MKNPKKPKTFSKIKVDKTRALQNFKLNLENQKLQLKGQKARLLPRVQVLGKAGFTPADANASPSFNREDGFYEWGVRLSWDILSRSFYENLSQKKWEVEEGEIDFEIFKQDLQNRLSLLEKKIYRDYANIKRAEKASKYQRQAFLELKRAFDKGRVDILELIQTEKQMRASETSKAQALSQYSLSLAQFLALRDEFVDGYLK